jgi:hypothetical protein
VRTLIRHLGILTLVLRGQVLTILRIVSQLPCTVSCKSTLHSSLSTIERKTRHRRAQDTIRSRPLLPRPSTHPIHHFSTFRSSDTMRRASAAEAHGHSRTYSISTVSQVSFVLPCNTTWPTATVHGTKKVFFHTWPRKVYVLSSGSFRHSAA